MCSSLPMRPTFPQLSAGRRTTLTKGRHDSNKREQHKTEFEGTKAYAEVSRNNPAAPNTIPRRTCAGVAAIAKRSFARTGRPVPLKFTGFRLVWFEKQRYFHVACYNAILQHGFPVDEAPESQYLFGCESSYVVYRAYGFVVCAFTA